MSLCNQFDIVSVPFPFTDGPQTKKRPAVVLSSHAFNQSSGHSLCAMITSQKNEPWPMDITIQDLKRAGLPAPSVIRMKVFTIDNRLLLKRIGTLPEPEQLKLKRHLSTILGDLA